jgi:hypothetical protein
MTVACILTCSVRKPPSWAARFRGGQPPSLSAPQAHPGIALHGPSLTGNAQAPGVANVEPGAGILMGASQAWT